MNFIEMHLFEGGHPVSFNTSYIALVRPASNSIGTVIILQLANRAEEMHLVENYDEVISEIHLSPTEHAARAFLEKQETEGAQ